MSHIIYLEITVIEPVTFSEKAATTGAHKTLDYVPGAALMGLAAAEFYRDEGKWVEGVNPWTAFHSGDIRFGNGYPKTASGDLTVPMPLCFHKVKGNDRLVYNLARLAQPKSIQLQQQRADFISRDAAVPEAVYHVPLGTNLKTAIDPESGTAASAQLFANQFIKPGAIFVAALSAEGEAASQLETIAGHLCGKHRIGRSRSAEYGLVKIERIPNNSVPSYAPHPVDNATVVFCASDVWLEATGCGQLPMPKDFGLEGGELDLARSFINYRRFTPYNGKWRVVMPERVLISAGSILVFKEGRGTQRIDAFVGAGTETGLGHVLFDPPFLSQTNLHEQSDYALLKKDSIAFYSPENSLDKTTNKLWNFMQERIARISNRENAYAQAGRFVQKFVAAYANARRLNASIDGHLAGPGKTQWNLVAETAKTIRSLSELEEKLFGQDALIPENDADWSLAIGSGTSHLSELKKVLKDIGLMKDIDQMLVVQQVARIMADKVAMLHIAEPVE